MSALTDAETNLCAQRHGIKTANAMASVLAMQSPPSFKIEVMVQGHFASSSTYNQTHAAALDSAMIEVIRNRLPELLTDALAVLVSRETAASDQLLRLALAVALTPSPKGPTHER